MRHGVCTRGPDRGEVLAILDGYKKLGGKSATGSRRIKRRDGKLTDNQRHSKLTRQELKNSWEINHESLEFEYCLAVGSAGKIWKGYWNGTLVAIKEGLFPIHSSADKELNQLLSGIEYEASLLRSLSHPNIIQVINIIQSSLYCFDATIAAEWSRSWVCLSMAPFYISSWSNAFVS